MLDSGSDGDLVFVSKGTSEVSYTRRNAAQKWRTSNGTFETIKVGILNMIFPNFSESKIASLKPDIFELSESAPKPAPKNAPKSDPRNHKKMLRLGSQMDSKCGNIGFGRGSGFGLDSGCLPGAPLDKYSKYHIQLTSGRSPKSAIWAPLWPPFWSPVRLNLQI